MNRTITVIVNGEPQEVSPPKKLSFSEVVALAFDPVPTGEHILLSVTYRNGPRQNPEGIIGDGDEVRLADGMIFDVTVTDKS